MATKADTLAGALIACNQANDLVREAQEKAREAHRQLVREIINAGIAEEVLSVRAASLRRVIRAMRGR